MSFSKLHHFTEMTYFAFNSCGEIFAPILSMHYIQGIKEGISTCISTVYQGAHPASLDKEYCLWSGLLEQIELPMLKCEGRQQQEFNFIFTEHTTAES